MSDKLQVGQKINLPASSASVASSSGSSAPSMTALAAKTAAPGAGQTTYMVKAGDNPSSIAAHELGDAKYASAILAANPGLVATSMHVGQQIILPSKSGAAAISSAVSASGSHASGTGATANRSTVSTASLTAPAVRSTASVSIPDGKPDFSVR